MNFFWIYSFPNWGLLLFLCAVFCFFGIIGFLITEPFIKKWLGRKRRENNIVANFLYVIGVFYGMTLGLIAVGTWNSYSDTQEHIFKEAAILDEFYRNVSYYPEHYKSTLQKELKDITYYIIHEAWPMQKKGLVPHGGNLDNLQKTIFSFCPETNREKMLLENSFLLFSKLFEARLDRLSNIKSGLPEELYWVLFIGAVINIGTTWLLISRKKSLHIITTALTGILIGTLIFLIVALDYPYRGEIISISSKPYELVYNNVMNK